ncbi:MAG: T9SS type A sorting domain-containing protein [Bacteroidia bacterium]|nr:T9SS type A sorting domain-containing protein [Bacteroidia bacterium]
MKKILIIALLLCGAYTKAQTYGQAVFGHTGYKSCTGSRTSIFTSGFLRGGYKSPVTIGTDNFYIDKASANGALGGTGVFRGGYQIQTSNSSCSGATSQNINCGGISVIEANISGTEWYAVAGSHDNGVFYSTLNSTGMPVVSVEYRFPSPNTNTPSKPLIARLSNGDFIITGQGYSDNMFALRINPNGNLVWSSFYSINTTSPPFTPKELIISPYNGNPIIVGDCLLPNSYSRSNDGFFMELDVNNGNVNIFKTYGNVLNGCQYFASICIANSNYGGTNGFIVAGQSDPILGSGYKWFLKLDPSGNVVWNYLYQPTTPANAQPVVGVIERLNTSSNYEIYGVAGAALGSVVLKLNDNGLPFSSGNNEFLYNPSSTKLSDPCAITYINSGPSSVGLHIYGTEDQVLGNNYFVKAYFNGQSGCNQTLQTISAYESGPNSVISPVITKAGSLVQCNTFSLRFFSRTVSSSWLCNASSIPAGSNARFGNDEESVQLSPIDSEVSLYPNPTSNTTKLKFFSEIISPIEIDIYDYTGKHIKTVDRFNGNQSIQYEVDIDFKELGVVSGVYFIKVNNYEDIKTLKVIYNK